MPLKSWVILSPRLDIDRSSAQLCESYRFFPSDKTCSLLSRKSLNVQRDCVEQKLSAALVDSPRLQESSQLVSQIPKIQMWKGVKY